MSVLTSITSVLTYLDSLFEVADPLQQAAAQESAARSAEQKTDKTDVTVSVVAVEKFEEMAKGKKIGPDEYWDHPITGAKVRLVTVRNSIMVLQDSLEGIFIMEKDMRRMWVSEQPFSVTLKFPDGQEKSMEAAEEAGYKGAVSMGGGWKVHFDGIVNEKIEWKVNDYNVYFLEELNSK